MSREIKIAERLKTKLLDELRLMSSADLQAYWQQAPWPKPNLVELSKSHNVELPPILGNADERAWIFGPLHYALSKLQPEDVALASEELDPFGCLLEAIDVSEWSEFCRAQRAPWMTRVWQAAASQLLAERKLIFSAHGWSDTWTKLRQNPRDLRAAENFHVAELRHAKGQRRTDLLAIRMSGLSEASRRRLRRARNEPGKRAGVAAAEKYMVQHWLELPDALPGLCFFSDSAICDLLEMFKLNSGENWATKQVRVRLGLIQAGVKQHLIEQVIGQRNELRFVGNSVERPWVLRDPRINWGSRKL